jgi:hypothetical protein
MKERRQHVYLAGKGISLKVTDVAQDPTCLQAEAAPCHIRPDSVEASFDWERGSAFLIGPTTD